MTIEIITAQLDRISEDSWYDVDDNRINLTINDFEGFDDDWSEIDREFVDAKAVEEVLDWRALLNLVCGFLLYHNLRH